MSFACFPKVCISTSMITTVCKIRRAFTVSTFCSSNHGGHVGTVPVTPSDGCIPETCRPIRLRYITACHSGFIRQNNHLVCVHNWGLKQSWLNADNSNTIHCAQERHYSAKHGTSNGHSVNENKIGSNATNSEENKQISIKKSIEQIISDLQSDMILTVPNVLTLMRMIMSPVIGYCVLQEFYHMACIMFIIAGVTDVLDGYIARNFPNQTSELGSFIDPLADKLLVSILFVSLTAVNLIPVSLTALVIFRDICLTAGGFYVRYISLNPRPTSLRQFFDLTNRSASLQPTAISKANTAIQLSLVAFTLGAPVFGYVDHLALQALWYVTASTTLISGIGYIFAKDTFKLVQQNRKK